MCPVIWRGIFVPSTMTHKQPQAMTTTTTTIFGDITTIREAYLQVCEIETKSDSIKFARRMMDASKSGLFLDEAGSRHYDQIMAEFAYVCKLKGIEA